MKHIILRTLAIAFAGISLCTLPMSADNVRNGGRHSGAARKEAPASRSNRNSRPAASKPASAPTPSVRPANNGSGNKQPNVRPSSGTNRGPRPGLSGNGNLTPSKPNGNHGQQGNLKPGNNHRPDNGHRPGNNHGGGNHFRPGNDYGHGFGHNHNNGHGNFGKPYHRPPNYHRPQPPRPPHGWHRPPHLPRIGSIFGINFGTAIGVSLNFLMNQGYTVRGYDNSQVWLRNVSIANYVWPDAALYYGNSGLDASSFYYTSPYYDPSRYNAVYANLVNTYGAPINYSTTHGAMSATWFGSSGYVTLTLGASTSGSYITTLSFGM